MKDVVFGRGAILVKITENYLEILKIQKGKLMIVDWFTDETGDSVFHFLDNKIEVV